MPNRENPTDKLAELKKEQEQNSQIKDQFSHDNEEETIFDEKDKLVEEKGNEEVDQISENEYKFKEEPNDKEVTGELLTVETAVTTEIKLARRSLTRSILWVLILILAIIFGTMSILDFLKPFTKFIDLAGGDNKDSWESARQFLIAFGYSFEAFLFFFIMVYSTIKIIFNLKPWLKFRGETAPSRNADKIARLTIEKEKLTAKLQKHGGEISLKEYHGEDQKKKISDLIKNNEKIKKAIAKASEANKKK